MTDKSPAVKTLEEAMVATARKIGAVARHTIQAAACDFAETPIPDVGLMKTEDFRHETEDASKSKSFGCVFFNPEYGIRLGDPAELAPIYERIGTFLNEKCRRWTGALITGNPDLARLVNLYYKKRIPFYNGPIDCRLFLYEGCELKGQNVNGSE